MKSFLKNMLGQTGADTGNIPADERDIHVATAVLLIQTARADDRFTDDERYIIVANLKDYFQLTDTEVENILARSEKAIENSLDDYEFTALLNDNFTAEEKIKIVEMVWRVIFSDNHLDGHEDHLAHRFARLLRLDHSQLIDAKIRVKRTLEKD